MKRWQAEKVSIDSIATWADHKLSEKWGKKAAARVFHIYDVGKDIEIKGPFASGTATESRSDIWAAYPALQGMQQLSTMFRRHSPLWRRIVTMPKSVLLGRLTSLYYWIALPFPPPDSNEIQLRVLRRFLWKDLGEQVKNSPDFLGCIGVRCDVTAFLIHVVKVTVLDIRWPPFRLQPDELGGDQVVRVPRV